jgi:hypothetical protein
MAISDSGYRQSENASRSYCLKVHREKLLDCAVNADRKMIPIGVVSKVTAATGSFIVDGLPSGDPLSWRCVLYRGCS